MTHFQYSASSLNNYKKCPLMFWFSRTKPYKHQGDVSVPMLTGRIAHDAFSEFIDKQSNMELIVEKLLLKQETIPPPEVADDVHFLAKVFEEWHPFESGYAGLSGTEKQYALNSRLKSCDWMAKDVMWRHKADHWYIDGDVMHIIDWKAGYKKDISDDQLQLYAWGMSKFFPNIKEFHVNYVFIRFRERMEPIIVTKAQTEATEIALLDRIEAIEEAFKGSHDGRLPPNPGSACVDCMYAGICDSRMKPEDVKTPEQFLVALAQAKSFMGSCSKKLQEETNGKELIHTSGLVAGYFDEATKRTTIDVMSFIEMMGGPAEAAPYLSVSNTAIKKIKDKDMQEVIEELKTVTFTRGFKWGKTEKLLPNYVPEVASLPEKTGPSVVAKSQKQSLTLTKKTAKNSTTTAPSGLQEGTSESLPGGETPLEKSIHTRKCRSCKAVSKYIFENSDRVVVSWHECPKCGELRPAVGRKMITLASAKKYLTPHEELMIPHDTGDVTAFISGHKSVGFFAICDVDGESLRCYADTADEVVEGIMETVMMHEAGGEEDTPSIGKKFPCHNLPDIPMHESHKSKMWTLNMAAKKEGYDTLIASEQQVVDLITAIQIKLGMAGIKGEDCVAFMYSVLGTVSPSLLAKTASIGSLRVALEDIDRRGAGEIGKIVKRGYTMIRDVQ